MGGARRGRRVLIVTQVALAVTVVAAAGLLTRSLLRLQTVDTGLTTDRLFLVSLSLPPFEEDEHAPRRLQLLDAIVARLGGVPGIETATPVNAPPFGGMGWDAVTYTAEGQTLEQVRTNPNLNFEAVHPHHFATLGVPILRGRAFADGDRLGAPLVAILTDDVATRIWPGADPVGKRLKIAGPESKDPWRTVVGIVKPIRYRELAVARPVPLPARAPVHRVRGVDRRAHGAPAGGGRGPPSASPSAPWIRAYASCPSRPSASSWPCPSPGRASTRS
jgi:hypothetical protein